MAGKKLPINGKNLKQAQNYGSGGGGGGCLERGRDTQKHQMCVTGSDVMLYFPLNIINKQKCLIIVLFRLGPSEII